MTPECVETTDCADSGNPSARARVSNGRTTIRSRIMSCPPAPEYPPYQAARSTQPPLQLCPGSLRQTLSSPAITKRGGISRLAKDSPQPRAVQLPDLGRAVAIAQVGASPRTDFARGLHPTNRACVRTRSHGRESVGRYAARGCVCSPILRNPEFGAGWKLK